MCRLGISSYVSYNRNRLILDMWIAIWKFRCLTQKNMAHTLVGGIFVINANELLAFAHIFVSTVLLGCIESNLACCPHHLRVLYSYLLRSGGLKGRPIRTCTCPRVQSSAISLSGFRRRTGCLGGEQGRGEPIRTPLLPSTAGTPAAAGHVRHGYAGRIVEYNVAWSWLIMT
jgi:hypothetical protein